MQNQNTFFPLSLSPSLPLCIFLHNLYQTSFKNHLSCRYHRTTSNVRTKTLIHTIAYMDICSHFRFGNLCSTDTKVYIHTLSIHDNQIRIQYINYLRMACMTASILDACRRRRRPKHFRLTQKDEKENVVACLQNVSSALRCRIIITILYTIIHIYFCFATPLTAILHHISQLELSRKHIREHRHTYVYYGYMHE